MTLFLSGFWLIALLLVLYYNAEFLVRYSQSLEVNTRSRGKLRFYSENPEMLQEMFKTKEHRV